ncbi:hypothetical protein [Synechococcus phage S-B64]|uniref:2OG-Fe(II) oxygenase n=2 Tax=Shandvirus TaxID=2948904 RepID=A0A1Z1LWM5_9CAUD|nr:2OG-Fe(II) oxygenase [Synechococcus phage S-H35]YP_010095273.1 2OG-Fe(II) oxygenase [Synechococcus phage S-B64]ARW57046.1 hypothetical protein [Synechococcus phage S-H35]AWD90071.1 hypothetical protein [Synechococcus phage S-B64]
MKEGEIRVVTPPNVGWLEKKLNRDEIGHIWKCIEQRETETFKGNLAGNIHESNLLEDIEDLFWHNTLLPLVQIYGEAFSNLGDKIPVNHKHAFQLHSWWVNYQKQNEFNPIHCHTGVYSFAIWMKIPTTFEQQNKNPISKNANSQVISAFEFAYTNILGEISLHQYKLSDEHEGMLVMFPSKLNHQVYPFFDCAEDRISVSGNIGLDTSTIINN